jgi:peptidyl-prolyl cis-trans isomerase D
LSEEELKAYYNEHTADYTNPEMIKVSGLVFGKKEQAESVLKRLENGADFDWVKSNAEGQLDSKKAPDIVFFDGSTKLASELPDGARKVLLGARSGEYRMYESSDGNFYVLYVLVAAPSSERPFKEVRQEIAKKVFDRKLNALLEDWTKKLREAGDVKVYLVSPAAEGEKTGKHSSEVTR